MTFPSNVRRAVVDLPGTIEGVRGCGRRGPVDRVVRARLGVHVQHHLIAIARGAASEPSRQSEFGQQRQGIGPTLCRRQLLGHRVARHVEERLFVLR
jgi:hypothetical protein